MFIRHKKTVSHENQYILWVGSLLKLSDLDNGLTASTAAVRWQTGFADGLIEAEYSIYCINKPSGLYWPNAPLILGRRSVQFYRDINGEEIRFLNLPKIRTKLASNAYLSALKNFFKNNKRPEFVIFYNITPQNLEMFYQLKIGYNIPCIILAADVPGRGHKEYDLYAKACNESDGVIYLSMSEYSNSKVNNKMHIDGGVSKEVLHKRLDNVPEAEPYFMYTGAFEPYCGVELMLDALEQTKCDFQLIICGTCKNDTLLERFKNNSRIQYKGYVSEEELEYLSQRATGFINSYLPSAPECEGKFPSKLFEYLSYGRAVVSTFTTGISSEYKDILYLVKDEDASFMAEQLDNVFIMQKTSDKEQVNKNKAFLETKIWEYQAKRFLKFINTV